MRDTGLVPKQTVQGTAAETSVQLSETLRAEGPHPAAHQLFRWYVARSRRWGISRRNGIRRNDRRPGCGLRGRRRR